MLIKELLERQRNNEKIAVICGKEYISYSNLYNRSAAASCVIESQFSENRNVGIYINQSINYIAAYFAISLAGRVIVPINPRTKKDELSGTLEYCKIHIILTDSVNIAKLRDDIGNYEFEVRIINMDTMTAETAGKQLFPPVSPAVDEPDDVALLIHTSGSVSEPKRVMLTNDNLISCAQSIITSLDLCENDRTLIALPIYLASANTSQMLTHIYLGASILIMNTVFKAGYFFRLVQEYGITNFTGVPYMMQELSGNKNKDGYDISSLRFICFGGAPMPAAGIELLMKSLPDINFIHMYGQTETSTRISHLLPEFAQGRTGSVGKPIPNVSWKLIDSKGNVITNSDIGEILVQGRNVMKGYFNRKADTEKVIKDGWLYTGDLGRLDAEGFLYITGRKKNVIIRGGVNIYPEEIEEVLYGHPAVKEACVLGEEHEVYGEVPVARIVLNEEWLGTGESELIDYCCRNLTSCKVPVWIYFCSAIPRTPTGKVLRY